MLSLRPNLPCGSRPSPFFKCSFIYSLWFKIVSFLCLILNIHIFCNSNISLLFFLSFSVSDLSSFCKCIIPKNVLKSPYNKKTNQFTYINQPTNKSPNQSKNSNLLRLYVTFVRMFEIPLYLKYIYLPGCVCNLKFCSNTGFIRLYACANLSIHRTIDNKCLTFSEPFENPQQHSIQFRKLLFVVLLFSKLL